MLKNGHLGISHSNCRTPETRRKSWKKPVMKTTWTTEEQGQELHRTSCQKACPKKRVEWNGSNAERKKEHRPRILHTATSCFKSERENSLSDERTQTECAASRPALQEMLKEVLQKEGESYKLESFNLHEGRTSGKAFCVFCYCCCFYMVNQVGPQEKTQGRAGKQSWLYR